MLDSVLGLVKLIRYRKCYIDERVFRLNCLFTSIILLLCFIIISTKQIAGEPIDCDTNHDSVKPSVLNTYCLIHDTYTVSGGFYKQLRKDVVAPGVRFGPKEEEIHYNYYQWIWFLFFMEALFFYMPRWLWKSWESGTIAHLVSGFTEFMDDEKKSTKKEFIVNYLLKSCSSNQSYGKRYLFCLFLSFCNVILQMSLINILFNGDFYTYGLKVFFFLTEDPETRRDALIKVFPRVTKCRFSKFGTSGVIQRLDALCVLPLNMYNEIIFVFLWFWFAILAFFLFLSISNKLVLLLSPLARIYYINKEFRLGLFLKKNKCNYETAKSLQFGEIFVLILIKQNTGVMFCNELVGELFKTKQKSNIPNRVQQNMDHLSHSQNDKSLDCKDEHQSDDGDEQSSLFDGKHSTQTAIRMTDTKIGSESTNI